MGYGGGRGAPVGLADTRKLENGTARSRDTSLNQTWGS